MAKIAILLLLVALVAVCNGARVTREESQKKLELPNFELPDVLKPLAVEFKKLTSQDNVDKLKATAEEFQEAVKKHGGEASIFFENVLKNLTATLEQNQHPK